MRPDEYYWTRFDMRTSFDHMAQPRVAAAYWVLGLPEINKLL